MAEELKGYEVPVCRALTIYPTISGIPREFFIIYVTLFFLFVVIYRAVYSIALFIPIFLFLRKVSKRDPLVLKIIFKYIREQKYFYGG